MLSQFDTSLSGELRVQPEDVDCELHLVDDALAVRLADVPKFEVFWAVISTIAVFVVHGLAFLKISTELFFHNRTMEKLFSAPAKVDSNVSSRVHVSIWVDWAHSPTFVSTFARAKTLLHVVARVTTVFGATQLALTGFATQFALKSRGWFLVHIGQLTQSGQAVKETA